MDNFFKPYGELWTRLSAQHSYGMSLSVSHTDANIFQWPLKYTNSRKSETRPDQDGQQAYHSHKTS